MCDFWQVPCSPKFGHVDNCFAIDPNGGWMSGEFLDLPDEGRWSGVPS